MIQVYRPTREIEDMLSSDGSRVKVTDVRLVDGLVQYHIQLNGRPSMFTEQPCITVTVSRWVGVLVWLRDYLRDAGRTRILR